ncbi:hypothetical protein NKH77_38910 [Streptomyces sp. M19]
MIDETVHALYGESLRTYLSTWRIDATWQTVPGDESSRSWPAPSR